MVLVEEAVEEEEDEEEEEGAPTSGGSLFLFDELTAVGAEVAANPEDFLDENEGAKLVTADADIAFGRSLCCARSSAAPTIVAITPEASFAEPPTGDGGEDVALEPPDALVVAKRPERAGVSEREAPVEANARRMPTVSREFGLSTSSPTGLETLPGAAAPLEEESATASASAASVSLLLIAMKKLGGWFALLTLSVWLFRLWLLLLLWLLCREAAGVGLEGVRGMCFGYGRRGSTTSASVASVTSACEAEELTKVDEKEVGRCLLVASTVPSEALLGDIRTTLVPPMAASADADPADRAATAAVAVAATPVGVVAGSECAVRILC